MEQGGLARARGLTTRGKTRGRVIDAHKRPSPRLHFATLTSHNRRDAYLLTDGAPEFSRLKGFVLTGNIIIGKRRI